MSNEIKEILDKLNKLEYDDIHLIICEVISRREIKILLDYITNLQEENQKLKELCDKYEEEHDNEFKKWLKDIKANKKAIRTLETLKGSARWERHLYEVDELLNILGGDEE